MDKIDKKILLELLKNSRIAYSKLGKKIRLSRENVHYRIQSLIKKGIINDFNTGINYKSLGFNHYAFFVQTENITEEIENDILNTLRKSKFFTWIGIQTGSWSIVVDLFVKNHEELQKVIDTFLDKYTDYISDYLLLQVLSSELYFSKLLNEKPNFSVKKPKKYALDEIDIYILESLNKDARKSYVDISKSLGLTPNTVKNRIKKLEDSSIILDYSISVNHKALEYEWYTLQIKMTKIGKEIENKMKQFFREEDKTIFYYQFIKSGNHDFEIGVIVRNSDELRNYMNEIKRVFHGQIQIKNSSLILTEATSLKLPKAVFEI